MEIDYSNLRSLTLKSISSKTSITWTFLMPGNKEQKAIFNSCFSSNCLILGKKPKHSQLPRYNLIHETLELYLHKTFRSNSATEIPFFSSNLLVAYFIQTTTRLTTRLTGKSSLNAQTEQFLTSLRQSTLSSKGQRIVTTIQNLF